MRPTDTYGWQSRPAPDDEAMGMSSFHNVSASQAMSYCIADEPAVDVSLDQSFSAFTTRARHDARKRDRPQQGPIPRSDPASPWPEERPPPAVPSNDLLNRPPSPSPNRPCDSLLPSCPRAHHQLSSAPMTPILLGVSGPASAFSGISSRRGSISVGSLSEDLGSVAGVSVDGSVAAGGHQEMDPKDASMEDSSATAPQLVMPSIRMPIRRPFTEEGKAFGKLKVLVAGAKGVGKTSLIKAIIQSCQHIVHVDPIDPVPTASPRAVSEIHGSTKPHPEWWADLEESRISNRRNSLGDAIINRNICFVDTAGFGATQQSLQDIIPVVRYIESQLERMSSDTLSDSDLAAMVGGDGGPQVDVVLYLVSRDVKPTDIQYLRMLAPLTNIIPLIAKSDTIGADDIWTTKQNVLAQLVDADVIPFRYSKSSPETQTEAVLSISSATGSDSEVMDASLLMSPDYIEPLLPSELSVLVRRVFSAAGASWLRHSAAKKYVRWRSGERNSRNQALYRPLSNWPPSLTDNTPQRRGRSRATSGLGNSGEMIARPRSSALALTPSTGRREEQLAQIRLANWASELQRSLDKERANYEALARGERAIWLTERLGECVRDGTLVTVRSGDGRRKRTSRSRRQASSPRGKQSPHPAEVAHHIPSRSPAPVSTSLRPRPARSQDPLGLLEMLQNLRAGTWMALEVLGSLGLLSGLALWMTGRYWHAYSRDDLRGLLSLIGFPGETASIFARGGFGA